MSNLTTKILYLTLLLLQAYYVLPSPQPAVYDQYSVQDVTKNFAGWNKITRIFSFGASYTATGFDWKHGVQPSPSNPFGNPASYKGHTSSNGPNFVMYLTTAYNKSMIQTYNFAWSGSPVTGMVGQIEGAFVPLYTGGAKYDPGWNPSTTLFVMFTGINDLKHWDSGQKYRDNVFKRYTGAIETLYSKSARNFIIYTVPPLDQSAEFKKKQKHERAAIDDYNGRLAHMLEGLSAKYQDASFWKVNMYALFDRVLEDPARFPQTSMIRDTRGVCKYYQDHWLKLPAMDYKHASCPLKVNEYAWLSGIHVTYPLHDLLAKVTVDALEA